MAILFEEFLPTYKRQSGLFVINRICKCGTVRSKNSASTLDYVIITYMKAVDLRDTVKGYKKGWVAINEKEEKVVLSAKSFEEISEKAKDMSDVVIMAASDNYFGFITILNG